MTPRNPRHSYGLSYFLGDPSTPAETALAACRSDREAVIAEARGISDAPCWFGAGGREGSSNGPLCGGEGSAL